MTISNNIIINKLKEAANNNVEIHFSIYNDGIWNVDIERHPYGCIRFWVSREDKLGNFNQSLFNVYEYNGEIRYSAEFKVAVTARNKIINTYKALRKAGFNN